MSERERSEREEGRGRYGGGKRTRKEKRGENGKEWRSELGTWKNSGEGRDRSGKKGKEYMSQRKRERGMRKGEEFGFCNRTQHWTIN